LEINPYNPLDSIKNHLAGSHKGWKSRVKIKSTSLDVLESIKSSDKKKILVILKKG